MFFRQIPPYNARLPEASAALPGRLQPILSAAIHEVLQSSLMAPYPDATGSIVLGLGCFWGAERLFWQIPGVYVTAAGYAGGHTPNPTYEEVCSGMTGHTEVVLVVYYPAQVTLDTLLKTFWEAHDPTQGMRQGNDIGTQYRSAVFCTNSAQLSVAESTRENYQAELNKQGVGKITTEIRDSVPFFFAESFHQQYLHKNPGGYCGLRGTGVTCHIG